MVIGSTGSGSDGSFLCVGSVPAVQFSMPVPSVRHSGSAGSAAPGPFFLKNLVPGPVFLKNPVQGPAFFEKSGHLCFYMKYKTFYFIYHIMIYHILILYEILYNLLYDIS